MRIKLNYALGEFTSRVIKPFIDSAGAANGFESWFPPIESGSSQVTWEIKRRGRQIAVDIQRHEKGKIISSVKSSQKSYIPPNFDLAVVMSAFDSFERVFGGSEYVDTADLQKLVEDVQMEMKENILMIERAKELQRAQALLTGIVTLRNGDDINFNRDAASLIAYNLAHDWNVATVNPGDILVQMAQYVITKGKAINTLPFDVILGSEAIIAFQDNPLREKNGDIKDQHYMELEVGATNRMGLTPQGAYSRGNHRFNFWGYEDYYDTDAASDIQFMDPKSIILLPKNTDFVTFYGATKAWKGSGDNMIPTVVKGKQTFYQVNDIENVSKKFGVRSAPVALLRSIDRVATATVIAP